MKSLWQKFVAAVVVLVCVIVYYVSSAGSGIWNKQLVDRDGGAVSPSVLTLLHLCVSLISDVAIMRLSKEGMPRWPPDHGRHSMWDIFVWYAPISVFVILSKLTTYLSYTHVSVALAHTAKASEPVFNVIIAALVFREYHSNAVYVSLVPIAAGVTLASVTDFTYNHAGFVWAILSALMKVLQNIYTKRLMNTGKFTFWEIHLYCGAASLVMLMPVIVTEIAMAAANPFEHFPVIQLFECSILQYVSSVSSYMVLNLVSHLTFTIVNVMKRLFIIISGSMFDGIALQPLNVFGVTVAMLGILLYNLVKDVPPGTPGPTNPWSLGSWAMWILKLAWKYNHPGELLSISKREDDGTAGASAPPSGPAADASNGGLHIRVATDNSNAASRSDVETPESPRQRDASDAMRRTGLLHSAWDSPIAGTPIKYSKPESPRNGGARGSSAVQTHALPPPVQSTAVPYHHVSGRRADAETWQWQRAHEASSSVTATAEADATSTPKATVVAPMPPSPNWGVSFGPHAGAIGVVQRTSAQRPAGASPVHR